MENEKGTIEDPRSKLQGTDPPTGGELSAANLRSPIRYFFKLANPAESSGECARGDSSGKNFKKVLIRLNRPHFSLFY